MKNTFTAKQWRSRNKKRKTFGVTKVKRVKRATPEHDIQVQLIDWLEMRFPGALFCASAGGMRTSLRTAARMKAAGYRKGFPDLFIYEPRVSFHGLAIELKTETGKPSPEQNEWIDGLAKRGYVATICYGYEEARQAIEFYLLSL